MSSRFTTVAAIVTIVFLLAGCHRTEPVYDVTDNPINKSIQDKYTQEQIGKIIIQAAVAKGWVVEKVKPGELHATIEWQSHSAISYIYYSKTEYSIELDSSDNLREKDGKIHRKYNTYVKQLRDEIDKRLSLAE